MSFSAHFLRRSNVPSRPSPPSASRESADLVGLGFFFFPGTSGSCVAPEARGSGSPGGPCSARKGRASQRMFQRKLRGAGALRGLLRSVSAQGAAVQGRGLAVSREGVDCVPTVYCRPLLERPRGLVSRPPGKGRPKCDLGTGNEANLNP